MNSEGTKQPGLNLERRDGSQGGSSVVYASEATYDHEAYSQIRRRSSSTAEDIDFFDDVFDTDRSMPTAPLNIPGQEALDADGSDNVVMPMAPRLRPCSPPATTVLLPPLEPEGSPAIALRKASKQASDINGDTPRSSSSGNARSSSSEGTSLTLRNKTGDHPGNVKESYVPTEAPSVPDTIDAERGGSKSGVDAISTYTGSSSWGATFGFRVDTTASKAAYASKASLPPPGSGRVQPQSPWFLVDGFPSFGLAQQSELKKRPAPQEMKDTSAALLKKLRVEQEASRALERRLLCILAGDQEQESHE